MKHYRAWFLIFILILTGCQSASIYGEALIKVNQDGSGQYRITLLTHPKVVDFFQAYKATFVHQQFQVKEITKGKRAGWVATKNVENLQQEPFPVIIPTFVQKPSSTTNIIQIDDGFYWNEITVDYPLDLTPWKVPALVAKRIHLSLIVSLPIPFEAQNANHLSSDKKTATWQLKVGEVNRIFAKVKVPNPKGWFITLIGCIMVAIIAMILFYIRKRKNGHQ